jgi:hypothetical protein
VTEPAALPVDIAGLLAELAAALNRRGMYPPGHPALAEAAARVAGRAEEPLRAHGEIVLAVARDRLFYDDTATDPSQPMMSDLAERLHRRRIGGVLFAPGFDEAHADALLDVLAPEPDGDDAGPAPWRCDGCALLPLRYDRLVLTGAQGTGTAAVWADLARAALGGEGEGAATVEHLAHAINESGSADPGVEREISNRFRGVLRAGVAEPSPELAPEIADLLRRLDPDRVRRLLELGGERAEVAALLGRALDALPADAVLTLLRAARGPEESISDSLLRILGKLAAQWGDGGATLPDPDLEAILRGQVTELVNGWQLADPNPDAYSEALQALAARRQGRVSGPGDAHRPAPLAIVRMAVELGATGHLFERALGAAVDADPAALIAVLEQAPAGGAARAPNAAVDAAWRALLAPGSLARVLETAGAGGRTVDLLLEKAGTAAIDPLLDRLATSEDRAERRFLLDRLAGLGGAVAPAAAARLEGAPWYVARNLLHLLRQTGGAEGISPGPYLGHVDARVRVEAVRLFAGGAARERAILAALQDEDASVVSAGLTAAAEACPPAAVALLADRATDAGLPDDVRGQAIRLTADHPTDHGRDALAGLAVRGRSLLLRRLKFADPSPIVLGALAALVRGWPDDSEVAEIRAAAARARHGGIRAAVRSST